MPIECDVWPMNILTRASGEKNRVLLVHPKPAVERKGIRRDKDGILRIIDPKAIKIKLGTYYPETKEEGHRHFLARDKKGKYTCFGRRLNVQKTFTDIYPKIKNMEHPDLPLDTVLDFELIWPGHPDSEVVTAIKECPEQLRCRCFGLPIFKGENKIGNSTYQEGRNNLLSFISKRNITKRYTKIVLTEDNKVSILEKYLNSAEYLGIEGFVLKSQHYGGWYKLKGINEADVFVSGFKVSDSDTRAGMITAIQASVMKGDKEVVVGKVSGFDMDQMKVMTTAYNRTNDENPYLGKVLRIIYQDIAGKGGLKHAFFDCWREDKNLEDCKFEQFK